MALEFADKNVLIVDGETKTKEAFWRAFRNL
jgi:hypothetical protein